MTGPRQRRGAAAPSYDLVIVGAGIVGAWCAYLAAKSSARVLVADRSLQASGATAYSAGLDLPYGASADRYRLTAQSEQMYDELLRDHRNLPIEDYPIFFLSHADDWELLTRRVTRRGLRLATAADLAQLRAGVPGLALTGSSLAGAGVRCRVADVAGVARVLLGEAVATGRVRLWEGTRVQAVDPGEQGCIVRFRQRSRVSAAAVVWATGPWLSETVPSEAAVARGVRVKRVVALHIDVPPPEAAAVCFSTHHDAFLMPLPGRRQWLLSFTREVWGVTPALSSTTLLPDDMEAGLTILRALAPEWADSCWSGRAFCDAYGPTRDPLVALWPRDSRVVFAGAGSGSGYRLAPAIASEALAAVLPEIHAERVFSSTPGERH